MNLADSISWLTWPALAGALAVFLLRVLNTTMDTLRVLFIVRSHKLWVWVFGFFQSLLYVVILSSVLQHLDNPLNVIGYAAGFATGNVIGIIVENRMAVGFAHLNIVSPRRGDELAECLRANGYAVTEIAGWGKDGTVNILICSVLRKYTDQVIQLVHTIDPQAFITLENLQSVQRGYWGHR